MEKKGPTLMSQEERRTILEGCKWVSEIDILDHYHPPYSVLKKYNADFIIHGDDIVLDADGKSIYHEFEKKGEFRICQRTTGISTTDIVHKILNIENLNFS